MTGGPGRQALGLAIAAAAVVLVVLAGPDSAPGAAPIAVPPDFQIPRAETSPGEVTFSHAAHRTKVDKCSTCHMRDLNMKRGGSGPITLTAKQEGKFCGACHDGKTTIGGAVVFPIDECDRCHK